MQTETPPIPETPKAPATTHTMSGSVQQSGQDLQVSPNKEGVDYDCCPNCGKEVELSYKSGGRAMQSGEEYRDWSIFSCDPRDVDPGCGTVWDRKTKQGAEQAIAKGIAPTRLTRDAEVDRTIFASPNNPRYRSEYSRIFGHD